MDVVNAELHPMVSRLPGEIIPKLKFSLFSCLRHVSVCANGNAARKLQLRIRSNAENRVTEVLKMKRELIQFCRTQRPGVISNKAVEFIVVCVAASQIRGCGICHLIVWRVVLLVSKPVEHALTIGEIVIHPGGE